MFGGRTGAAIMKKSPSAFCLGSILYRAVTRRLAW